MARHVKINLMSTQKVRPTWWGALNRDTFKSLPIEGEQEGVWGLLYQMSALSKRSSSSSA